MRKPEELDYLIRLFLIPFSPLNLGYREYRDIHMGYHKFTATSSDPDAFHILGGPLSAFFGAVTQLVHYRSGVAGTFPIPLPAYLLYPTLPVYGKDVVYGTMYHDIHHKHSMVAAKYLRIVAKETKE